MKGVLISAKRPEDVARDVARHAHTGATRFVISTIDHGGMLDRERLGAARYAAGLQSLVELEEATAAAAAVR